MGASTSQRDYPMSTHDNADPDVPMPSRSLVETVGYYDRDRELSCEVWLNSVSTINLQTCLRLGGNRRHMLDARFTLLTCAASRLRAREAVLAADAAWVARPAAFKAA
jgi:hypothetical protein